MSEGISFNSKIDLWLLVVLLLAVAVCLLPALQLIGGGGGALRLAAIPLLLVAAFVLWLLVSTRYLLLQQELQIRCGPFKWTVPINEITAVAPTRSPWSSPALSLDRLRIDYAQGRSIMISPEPRQEFLRQLQARRV
jgi:hypothetical protein